MTRRIFGLVIVVLLTGALFTAASAAAATITVNTEADAVANDGHCSLREAISAVNTDTPSGSAAGECPAGDGSDTVIVPAGVYRLSRTGAHELANATGDLNIARSVTISGAGAEFTTISGEHADRVLDIAAGTTVSIANVTIADGLAPPGAAGGDVLGGPGGAAVGGAAGNGDGGGGIRNAGALTLTQDVVRDNAAGSGGSGGAATGGAGGPAASGGSATAGNGGNGGAGGGILNVGTLTLNGTNITGNSAGAGGPGGGATGGKGGNATVSGSGGNGGGAVGGNGGKGGDGGGIATSGTLVATASTFAENSAGDGAVGGSATGADGGNFAVTGNGGLAGSGQSGSGGNGGSGGAVSATGGVTLLNVTVARDQAGDGGDSGGAAGGFGGDGTTAAAGGSATGAGGGDGGAGGAVSAGSISSVNTTFDHNRAGDGGGTQLIFGGFGGNSFGPGVAGGQGGSVFANQGGFGGSGGAIVAGAPMSISQATISDNKAGAPGRGIQGDPGLGGAGENGGGQGPFGTNSSGGDHSGGSGGGIVAVGGSASIANSILAGNTPAACAGGPITDGGFNLQSPATVTCPGTVGDPQLGALADNGGPVMTRALSPSSPAIDQVPASGEGCPATDARGVSRPHGGSCDIGAYEVAAADAATSGAAAITATAATIGGSVTANARPTSFHFEYGISASYGLRTADARAGASVDAVPVSEDLSGLTPSTTYHYRLIATNADGTTVGVDASFTTAAAAVGHGSPGAGPPTITSLSLNPHRFAAGAKPATFRFTLSQNAKVLFTIERVTVGRINGKKCAKPTRASRAKRHCTVYVPFGSFLQPATKGRRSIQFAGKVGRRKLPPGSYRATLTATNAAGLRSSPARIGFVIVRR